MIRDPDRSPLLLAADTAVLRQAGVSRTVQSKVYQTLSCSSSVYLEFSGTTPDDFLDVGPVDVHLCRTGVKFQGYARGIEVTYRFHDGHQSLKQRVLPGGEPLGGRASRTLLAVEFALINGAEFFLRPHGDGVRNDGVALATGDWTVHLGPVTREHRSLEEGIEVNAASLTHSGTLRRASGVRFGSPEAEQVLSALGLFLSFAAGWWVGVGFIRGKNTKGKVAWQQWGISRVQAKGAGHSWYHWQMEGMLAQLFPGFVRLLSRPSWEGPLESVLYWYNRSNSTAAGVDGSIILTQAAFELLAWQVLVQESHLLSEDNFHALNAEGQVRVLLGHLGIPLAIPAGLVDLGKLGKELNWVCGPQALVAIRNQLVHPAKKRGKAHVERQYPYYEAWLLGQHLMELCILRLCGYEGTYIDRTKVGVFPSPEPVPWSTK